MPSPNNNPFKDVARSGALMLLKSVCIDKKLLSDAIQASEFIALPAQDRARATRLASATLRYAGRADYALKPFLQTPPPDHVQNILRLGVCEMMQFDAPPHGVINTLVALCAQERKAKGYKGLVNAVLRKSEQAARGKWDKMPVPALPKWLRKPLISAYGNSAVMAIETAHMRGAQADFSVRKSENPQKWAEALGGAVLPNGTIRVQNAGQISALMGYDAGAWWVQDAAAAMAVQILRPAAGAHILDLCAAPGGKTLQMASAGANVTAVDNNTHRLKRLYENITRMGLEAKITVQKADVLNFKAAPFDAVLLDAPCSGTGTLRRHPDLAFVRDGVGLEKLIQTQAKMLRAVAKLTKRGGRLVYCTCSLLPQEGEQQAVQFLKTHPNFTIDTSAHDWIDSAWRSAEGGLRLRPDYWSEWGGMDGFYIACFQRQ